MNFSFEKYNWIFKILLLAVILLIVVNSSQKMIKSSYAKGDMEAFLHAAHLITKGENIYETPSRDMSQGGVYYLYLPLLAILFIPLALLPVNLSIFLWTIINVFLVFWCVKTFYEIISTKSFWTLSIIDSWVIGIVPILLCLRFILHHLTYGQANILVMSTVILGLKLLKNKQCIGSGCVIGIALILKIVAIPFVFLFAAKTNLKLMLGLIIGIFICGILFPSIILGFTKNWDYLNFWIDNALLNEVLSTQKVPLGVNISLQAQMQRFFTSVSVLTYKDKPIYLTIYTLSPQILRVLSKLIQVAIILTIVHYAIKFRNAAEVISQWGGVALCFALIPLFAPTTQKHYLVMLLPTYIYVIYVWYCLRLKDRWFQILIIASFVLTTLTVDGLVGKTLDDFFTAVGCIAYGTILLVVAVFRASHCLADRAISVGSPTIQSGI